MNASNCPFSRFKGHLARVLIAFKCQHSGMNVRRVLERFTSVCHWFLTDQKRFETLAEKESFETITASEQDELDALTRKRRIAQMEYSGEETSFKKSCKSFNI